MSAAARFGVLAFLGMLFAQAAWLLALPPYHGIDEFDHVYRAAGVASGQWRLTEDVPEGRGLRVVVPTDIAAAAEEQCSNLPYTMLHDCVPIEKVGDEQVAIATAAGTYQPLYYWAVGIAAQPFEGDAANYVMRAVTALVSALWVGVAGYCLSLAGAGFWTRLGLVTSLTPVLVYSTTVAAPNAWEMVAGLGLWTSLLALVRAPLSPARARVLIGTATVSGAALATFRMLGPLFLALIVLVVLAWAGRSAVLAALRRNPASWAIGSALVVGATLASAWWITSGGQTDIPDRDVGKPLVAALLKPITWTLGTVGAFPFRDQPAPLPTYVLYFAVVLTFLVAAYRRGTSRERTTLLGAVALMYAVPLSLTILTFKSHGTIWQGRYGLPFVVGILLLAGLVLDRTDWASRDRTRLATIAVVFLSVAHVWSVWEVARFELERVQDVASPSWVALPAPVVGAVMAMACAFGAYALLGRYWRSSGPLPPGTERRPEGSEGRASR